MRLLAKFVGGEMISFAVGGGGGVVGVCRKIVKLRGPLVGTLWHSVLLAVKGDGLVAITAPASKVHLLLVVPATQYAEPNPFGAAGPRIELQGRIHRVLLLFVVFRQIHRPLIVDRPSPTTLAKIAH